ncbi:BcsE family c-di-GMP-binding protein [Orrella marina]|uniref:Cellulose biosynthesis protein BcsE n=1 Tax=Orrella marina TaxID=2163011 RepID=A0A2R4XM31_9BURK|nr:BcsE family c-di-GMP-binding protein [Orrella marina]AWB34824.1 hypothetical protein DBV39_15050 [Orrella marina]
MPDNTSSTPDFLYRITIDGLPVEMECLRTGAIYLINFDEWDDCTLLLRQILRKADVSTRGVLITTSDASASVQRMQDTISAHDLRTFRFIEGSLTALKTLTNDLDATIRPHQRTIILMLPESVTSQISQEHRRAILASAQQWIAKNDCAALILSTGGNLTRNSSAMLENNDLLAGLVHLTRISETQLEYRCAYWRSALGVTGVRNLSIIQKVDELHVQADMTAQDPMPTVADGNRYIIERSVLKDFGQIHEAGWEIIDSREQVYERARQQVNATVIFALNSFQQLPEIARLIHSLRRERGPLIKLVVRESISQLRLRDEQNLLDCGATLVLGTDLSYTRFKSLLENIQTVRYTRELSQSVDSLFPEEDIRGVHGVVAPSTFLTRVHARIKQDLKDSRQTGAKNGASKANKKSMEFLGLLVSMQPVPGLSAQQALNQLNIRRFEDLACSVADEVYVFLHGCLPEVVPAVLQQLFRLPFDEIFINHTVFEDLSSIQGALQHIEERMSQLDDVPQASTDPATESAPGENAIRYAPQRVRLSLV